MIEDMDMNNGKIGVGIVGTGGWARYGHIAALNTLDEVELVAIGSRTQATADAVAAQYGIPNAFSDEQALIDHPDVDLVVVLTPALDHARLARRVIAAGKDVYSEWPLSTTTAESKELLAAAQAVRPRFRTLLMQLTAAACLGALLVGIGQVALSRLLPASALQEQANFGQMLWSRATPQERESLKAIVSRPDK